MSDEDLRPVPRPVGAVTLTLLAWAVITVVWDQVEPLRSKTCTAPWFRNASSAQ